MKKLHRDWKIKLVQFENTFSQFPVWNGIGNKNARYTARNSAVPLPTRPEESRFSLIIIMETGMDEM